jgi:membrane-associated protein
VTTVLQFISMVIAIIVGALVGESIGFAIGRYFGPKLRYGRLGRRLGPDKIARADRFVDRRGGIAVFISRFLPVFHSVVPMTAGMSKMRYRTFMAWTAPACALWAFIYVSVGSGAAETYRELQSRIDWAGWVFIGFFVIFFLAFWVAKHFLWRYAQKESALDETADAPTAEADSPIAETK